MRMKLSSTKIRHSSCDLYRRRASWDSNLDSINNEILDSTSQPTSVAKQRSLSPCIIRFIPNISMRHTRVPCSSNNPTNFLSNTTAYMYMYFVHPATNTKERARGRHAGCEWAMQVRHAFLHACIDGALVWPRVTEIPGWRV